MKIEISIDRTSFRRLAILAGSVCAVFGGYAAVHAAPVTTDSFAAGEQLEAKKLTDNFGKLRDAINAGTVPAGTIMAYGGEIDRNPGEGTGALVNPPPSGWLLCNGLQLNGLDPKYAALYAAIKVNFGGNTTSLAFNLPDLRGRFVRGVDGTAGRDKDATDTGRLAMTTGGNIGNRVGSVEKDSFAAHDHGGVTDVDSPDHTHGYSRPVGGSWGGGSGSLVSMGGDVGQTSGGASVRHRHGITSAGGGETRPINANVNWIIKY